MAELRKLDMDTKLLRIGIGGSIVAALCCFTPLLVLLLGAIGAAAWIGYLDYVLLPALALFLAVTAYAWHRRRHAQACRAPGDGEGKNNE